MYRIRNDLIEVTSISIYFIVHPACLGWIWSQFPFWLWPSFLCKLSSTRHPSIFCYNNSNLPSLLIQPLFSLQSQYSQYYSGLCGPKASEIPGMLEPHFLFCFSPCLLQPYWTMILLNAYPKGPFLPGFCFMLPQPGIFIFQISICFAYILSSFQSLLTFYLVIEDASDLRCKK